MDIYNILNNYESFFNEVEKINKYYLLHYHFFNHFEKISQGSSRSIFKINDEYVLKLAVNDSGIYQNYKEILISKKEPTLIYFENSFSFSDSCKYSIMKFKKDLNDMNIVNESIDLNLIEMEKVLELLDKYQLSKKQDYLALEKLENYIDNLKYENRLNNRLLKEIIYISNNYNVLLLDLIKKDSWGFIDDKLKITDYGLEPKMFKIHHLLNNYNDLINFYPERKNNIELHIDNLKYIYN